MDGGVRTRPLPGPGRRRLSPGCGLRTGAAGSARCGWRPGEGHGRSAREGRGTRIPGKGWSGDHAARGAAGPERARDARRGCGGGARPDKARGAGAKGDGVDGERGCHRAREQAPKSARCGRGERGQGMRTDRAGYEGPAGEGRRRAHYEYEDQAEFILRSSHDWIAGARCQYFCNGIRLQLVSSLVSAGVSRHVRRRQADGTRVPAAVQAGPSSSITGRTVAQRTGGCSVRRSDAAAFQPGPASTDRDQVDLCPADFRPSRHHRALWKNRDAVPAPGAADLPRTACFRRHPSGPRSAVAAHRSRTYGVRGGRRTGGLRS